MKTRAKTGGGVLGTRGGFTEAVMWQVGVPLREPSQGSDPPAGPLEVQPPPGTVAFVHNIFPPETVLIGVDREAMLRYGTPNPRR